jgi:predicted NAD-dependent protein-ADP-ribosyltransferase YbiA (DUF1768 family)
MGAMLIKWEEMSDSVLAEIWRLKWSQSHELKTMLFATKNARLVHYMKKRGQKAKYQHWEALEELRREFRQV